MSFRNPTFSSLGSTLGSGLLGHMVVLALVLIFFEERVVLVFAMSRVAVHR